MFAWKNRSNSLHGISFVPQTINGDWFILTTLNHPVLQTNTSYIIDLLDWLFVYVFFLVGRCGRTSTNKPFKVYTPIEMDKDGKHPKWCVMLFKKGVFRWESTVDQTSQSVGLWDDHPRFERIRYHGQSLVQMDLVQSTRCFFWWVGEWVSLYEMYFYNIALTCITHRIHARYMYYIHHTNQPHVGKYTKESLWK